MRALRLLLTAGVVALAGCGGSSSPTTQASSSAVTTGATPTTTSAPSSTSTTPSTPSTATTPLAATPTLCRAPDLAAEFLGGNAAMGHGLLGFALRNTTGHSCVTFGYPGVQFLSKDGRPLPTMPTHTTEDYFGTVPDHPLAVSPGATVSFRLGVTHGAASTAPCATAYALQVIPPNDTSTLRVSIPEGAYECQTTTVSPMQRGTSAYP